MKPKKYYDRLKSAVLFLVLSFSVIACKNDDPDPIAIKNEQTVFMYMPWASNLLSAFRRNIDDMEKAILERGLRNEKVLVFLAETPTQASLFEFVYNKSPFYPAEKKKVTRKVLKEYRFSSTPEYTTTAGISSILKDVRSYAEARRYGMVIGCHGMGWLPVVPTKKKTLRSSRQTDKEMPEVYKKHWEYTDRPMTRYFGGFDSQYQTEIKTLADAIADAGMKMEYILFDDCYMATVEVAYELRKATDYLIGSTCEIMEHGMTSDSVYLWTLPMFHCNGWCFTWAVVAIGGTNVCLRKVVPEEIYRLVELEGISHLCAAPTVLIAMAGYPGAKNCKMKTTLNVITAGAPPAPTVIKNMESQGAVVTQVYGLTEVYGPHSICEWQREWDGLDADEKAKIKARQGVPYINSEFMTVMNPTDMSQNPLDGVTIGEIVMRGNNVMLGYYKQPQETDEAFRGGWFHSGDLAVTHPNGYVEIKDRMKDIIISGGENISTVEVENVIYQHPDVMEVAVVAVPDPKWGEVAKAFVVPKPGTNPSAEDIINFCRDKIARFKVPKHIEFGELPKTSTGKIMKYRLREKEWKGFEKKVN